MLLGNGCFISRWHGKDMMLSWACMVFHGACSYARHAGQQAKGATAYVTLEPCNHYGRTPPCSRALVEAGISRVSTASVWTSTVLNLGPVSSTDARG